MELNYNFKNFDDLDKILEKAMLKAKKFKEDHHDVELFVTKSKMGFWNLKIEVKDGSDQSITLLNADESN
jgi:hypothetical protein